MSLTPYVKLAALAVGAVSYCISLTPPTPPPTEKDKVYSGQLLERLSLVRVISFSSKHNIHSRTRKLLTYVHGQTFVALMFACEFIVTASVALPLIPTQTIHALCPTSHSLSSLKSLQPSFILGFLLVFAGALLRVWCYASLGSLHTYEVTLRPSHSVITSGPYAYARHPSYTSVGMSILGVLAMHFSEGGWNRACGMMGVPVVKMGWALYAVLAVFVGVSLKKRAGVEDSMLREVFGERWEGG